MQLVTITSQGQISLPAKIRKNLGLHKFNKALVSQRGDMILVQPVADVLSSGGVFGKYALKNKSISEVMKLESEAWEKAAISRSKTSEKISG